MQWLQEPRPVDRHSKSRELLAALDEDMIDRAGAKAAEIHRQRATALLCCERVSTPV